MYIKACKNWQQWVIDITNGNRKSYFHSQEKVELKSAGDLFNEFWNRIVFMDITKSFLERTIKSEENFLSGRKINLAKIRTCVVYWRRTIHKNGFLYRYHFHSLLCWSRSTTYPKSISPAQMVVIHMYRTILLAIELTTILAVI